MHHRTRRALCAQGQPGLDHLAHGGRCTSADRCYARALGVAQSATQKQVGVGDWWNKEAGLRAGFFSLSGEGLFPFKIFPLAPPRQSLKTTRGLGQLLNNIYMNIQPFIGELRIEDPKVGDVKLFPGVYEDDDGKLVIELHNANPPNSLKAFIPFRFLRLKSRWEWEIGDRCPFFSEAAAVSLRCGGGG